MGTWQLEVAKMALYVGFPVVMFHVFNHSEDIEQLVAEAKANSIRPLPKETRDQLKNFIEQQREFKEMQEQERIEREYRNKQKAFM